MTTFELESQVRKWRGHLRASGTLGEQDLEELESHLRDSIDDLVSHGVTTEEAFLVSVRRVGDTEALGDEFAKISTESVWRQLLVPAANVAARRRQRSELLGVLGLAILAGLLGKMPALLGYGLTDDNLSLYMENLSLFVLPSVAIYLIWRRSLGLGFMLAAAGVFIGAGLLVNLYPSRMPHDTTVLIGLHLPIALLLLMGVLYGGPGWRTTGVRLDFVRFAGEVFIYAVLIALGGVVLIAVSVGAFQLVQIDIELVITDWVVVFGGCALLVVAAYLVERKKGRMETIAPVLARIFTPLLFIVLASRLVAIVITGRSPAENRELLIWFDALLALVLGMTLYMMSARDAEEDRNFWDGTVFALLAIALIVDSVALVGIASRLADYGVTPNRLAALVANILLFVNLLLSAIGYARFLWGKFRYQRIIEVQMRYLPVYAVWAALVVVLFPPLFGFR
jgi:hypothetical protein